MSIKTAIGYNTETRKWEVRRMTTVYAFDTLSGAVAKCAANDWLFDLV